MCVLLLTDRWCIALLLMMELYCAQGYALKLIPKQPIATVT